MPLTVTFEDLRAGRRSRAFGPYDFVQLTHDSLRVGEDGTILAALDDQGDWQVLDSRDDAAAMRWSDVVIAERQGGEQP
jgi:predicted nucleic acid-binding protein